MQQVIFLKKNTWHLIIIILCSALALLADILVPVSIPDTGTVNDFEIELSCTSIDAISKNTGSEIINYDFIRGIWFSQFDMQPVFTEKGVQRNEQSYTDLVSKMLLNIKNNGFNTVFLQLRPNGDSMYASDIFPVSKYVSGSYGQELFYDAVGIFTDLAHKVGISVHGWINPLRLMKTNEIESIDDRFIIKQWYKQQNGRVIAVGDRLYLNPAYTEVRGLITDGVSEIMERYDMDGIHMDDYFYPTTDADFDAVEFASSGFDVLGDFRRDNINLLVKGIYQAVKTSNSDARYGIAPAGNLYSLREGYYADVNLWCSQKGYIDYIMPQLYFGFLNKSCPFDIILSDWVDAVTEPEVRLVIGLTAAKAVMAVSGEIDVYAGTEEGKNEWINNKDILRRSLIAIYEEKKASGYCIFCYHYLFDVLTGEVNPDFAQERKNIGKLFVNNN